MDSRERSISWLPPIRSGTRDQTFNLGMCLDQEPDLQLLQLRDNAPTNRATPARASAFLIVFLNPTSTLTLVLPGTEEALLKCF